MYQFENLEENAILKRYELEIWDCARNAIKPLKRDAIKKKGYSTEVLVSYAQGMHP